jgi:hypothetical protein
MRGEGTRRSGVWLTAVLALGLASSPVARAAAKPGAADPHTRHVEVLSDAYTIDRLYKSMAGPEGNSQISLWPPDPPELLWITGYRVVVVGADGKAPVSQEFMCHNNLDFHPGIHSQLFDSPVVSTPRLFTLSQGQFAVDLPAGFGLPVMSNEPLYLSTQVLNHNRKNINIQVRHKVTIDFVRDKELSAPIRPLFPAAGFVVALLEGKDGNFAMTDPGGVQGHASCLPGVQAPDSKYSNVVFTDSDGRKATGHWVVKRGREERHTLVTSMMRLPYDTMIHFIGVHLHPFAESLELRDLTTGKTIFKSKARGPKEGIGLAHVDAFSSREGIPVYKSHDYELVSVYDNKSAVDQDAMATMFFYLEDKAFKKPALAQ